MTLRPVIFLLLCACLSSCSEDRGASLPTIPLTSLAEDRAGFHDLIPAYLAALVAHYPSLVPLAENAVLVENAVRIAPGEGLWTTASGAASHVRMVVADPESRQVGAIVMMEESGAPVEVALHLQAEGGHIVGMELLIARNLQDEARTTLVSALPAFATETPAAERLKRGDLLCIAGRYDEAIDRNDGSLAPFSNNCLRRENGGPTSLNSPVEGAIGFALLWQLSCAAQLDTGAMAYINRIKNRRVSIADPLTGLVFGLSHFRHSMEQSFLPLTGLEEVSEFTVEFEPFDMAEVHIFKMGAEGRIQDMEAMGFRLPYNAPTG